MGQQKCQYTNTTSKSIEIESAKEVRRLKQLLKGKEKDKEIDFLKNNGILGEENRLFVYKNTAI